MYYGFYATMFTLLILNAISNNFLTVLGNILSIVFLVTSLVTQYKYIEQKYYKFLIKNICYCICSFLKLYLINS